MAVGRPNIWFDDVAVFLPYQPWPLFGHARSRIGIREPGSRLGRDDQELRQSARRHFAQPEAEQRVAYGIARQVPETGVPDSPGGGMVGCVALRLRPAAFRHARVRYLPIPFNRGSISRPSIENASWIEAWRDAGSWRALPGNWVDFEPMSVLKGVCININFE